MDKVGAGHSFRAYFIVDPDQVIMMTMLILRNMMMLRNAEDDNAAEEDDITDDGLNDEAHDHPIELVAWARWETFPCTAVALGIDEMVWQVRNIPSLSSGVV